jgi:hypothetical protein
VGRHKTQHAYQPQGIPARYNAQKDRPGRLLLDLSFAIREQPTAKHTRRRPNSEQIIQPSVNETMTKLCPQAPLTELGRVLPRLFDFMAQVPPEETINFSKIDLSDGFWRMVVTEADKWSPSWSARLPNTPRYPPCPPNGVDGEPRLLLCGDRDRPRHRSSPGRLQHPDTITPFGRLPKTSTPSSVTDVVSNRSMANVSSVCR